MDALITALSELRTTNAGTVLATPAWAANKQCREIQELACNICLAKHEDKVVVEPKAINSIRKYGYDIKVLREATHVLSIALHTKQGIFVLQHNEVMIKNTANIIRNQLRPASWWKRWLKW